MFENVEEGHPDKDEDKTLHFYYSREHRLQNAPQIVKDYYDGKMKPVRGFKVLFNKQNRYILFALVFFVGAVWIYSGLNGLRYSTKIGNVLVELQASSFEEEIYTTVKLYDKKNSTYQTALPVTAEVKLINNDNQMVNKDNLDFMYSGGEQFLRTKATDYDIIRVDAVVSIGKEKKELSANIKR